MAPPAAAVAAVRNHSPHLLLRCGGGGLLPSPPGPATLPFASREPLRLLFLPRPRTPSFTGIVEEVGRVRRLGPPLAPSSGGGGGGEAPGLDLEVETRDLLAGTQLGDSVAVDGTCLTVAAIDPAASTLTFGVAPETLRRTSLGGGPRATASTSSARSRRRPAWGHFVQGHVDGTGEIAAFRPDGDSLWVTVRAPPEILRLLVPKGFVAVDGTSLTVQYTQDNIVLPTKKVGDKVNLEADILGKYVEKLLAGRVEAMAKVDS
ncbi:unnamed protein product [Miscanthus lutarioriparius]|uniref:Lumazine-binding domain-containing protein n=1 Tax=Miscanthus lutarioriparius TaxID=422564 RepID=A0A811SKH3_9POAL|nr:unnamed protein product [Miscanthus lutarioriparius]